VTVRDHHDAGQHHDGGVVTVMATRGLPLFVISTRCCHHRGIIMMHHHDCRFKPADAMEM